MDFRNKENRREAFIRWFAWSVMYKDCDPAVWMTNYINRRYEHNSEEVLWLCWLYGNTYQLPTAWVVKNEFPDFELATFERLDSWNTENYKKLRYQNDTKWNKGHLPIMFKSYKEFIGENTQREKIEYFYEGSPDKNFEALWEAITKNLFKFGRYSTWFYLQHLKHTAGVDIDPTSLMLSDYGGSRSHRNGLLLALGKDDDVDRKLSSEEYRSLESMAFEILQETKERFPELRNDIDFFTMETCLCSFKKIFRSNNGRYLGYYLDRQSEEIQQAEGDGWYGICWDVLWQARDEELDSRLTGKNRVKKNLFDGFLETGELFRSDWLGYETESAFSLSDFEV